MMSSLLLLLAACSISEDDYPARAADAYCDRIEECTRTFDSEDERASCESVTTGLLELFVDAGDLLGAVYNPSAGGACVREIRSVTCAEFNESQLDCDVFAEE